MYVGNTYERLAILLSLVIVTAANATPTGCSYDKQLVAGAWSPRSDTHITLTLELDQVAGPQNPELARIAAELLQPPAGSADSSAYPIGTKPLPGVPAALFMALTGFFCVSFVKDRRVWLAGLAGLLWLGQAGLSALPELASHIAGKRQIKQQSADNLTCLHAVKHCGRLRSDIEGTQYIGLLRHLAGIPDVTVSHSISALLPSLRARRSRFDALRKRAVSAQLTAPEFALTRLVSHIIETTSCPACAAEQPVCFSPAFIFSSLARGPPASA